MSLPRCTVQDSSSRTRLLITEGAFSIGVSCRILYTTLLLNLILLFGSGMSGRAAYFELSCLIHFFLFFFTFAHVGLYHDSPKLSRFLYRSISNTITKTVTLVHSDYC